MLLLMSILPLWIAYHHSFSLNDDTYITLTYAKNIANGRGFVFNHPPATLGTTTPLLTFLVAGLSWILPRIELHRLAVIFTALCWAGSAWLVYLGREDLGVSKWQAVTIGGVIIRHYTDLFINKSMALW